MIDRGEGERFRARGGGGRTPEARKAAAAAAEAEGGPEEARIDGRRPASPSPCER